MLNISATLESMKTGGYVLLGQVLPANLCKQLLNRIRNDQIFSPDIFLEEHEFLQNPKFKDVNPKPGRNLLEKYETETSKIEQHPTIKKYLGSVLGDSYSILNKKIICGVPEQWMPGWLKERLKNNPVNNLGAYVRPELRHITYFYGIDFHQDIIDWPGREPDFITLYVYLHDVGPKDAPLFLLSASHRFGVDTFPHNLNKIDNDPPRWRYISGKSGKAMETEQLILTGGIGTVSAWHSFIMHGTQPNYSNSARISLRYLIAKNVDSRNAQIDEINKDIVGSLSTDTLRRDLQDDGAPVVKLNYLYDEYKSNGKKS